MHFALFAFFFLALTLNFKIISGWKLLRCELFRIASFIFSAMYRLHAICLQITMHHFLRVFEAAIYFIGLHGVQGKLWYNLYKARTASRDHVEYHLCAKYMRTYTHTHTQIHVHCVCKLCKIPILRNTWLFCEWSALLPCFMRLIYKCCEMTLPNSQKPSKTLTRNFVSSISKEKWMVSSSNFAQHIHVCEWVCVSEHNVVCYGISLQQS